MSPMNRLVFIFLLLTPLLLGSSTLIAAGAPDQEAMVSLDFPDVRGGNGPQKVGRGQAPDSSVALRLLLAHVDRELDSRTVQSCSKYCAGLAKGSTFSSLIARLLLPEKTNDPAIPLGYRCQAGDGSTIRCWIDQFDSSSPKTPTWSLSFALDAMNYRLRIESLRCEGRPN